MSASRHSTPAPWLPSLVLIFTTLRLSRVARGTTPGMTSLWLANRVETATPPGLVAGAEHEADVVVIGAGITGLTTAVLLARAAKRVVVLEARYVGAGATGNTTGKVSLLQGTKLSRIAAKHGGDTLRAYADGNTEGRDWLLRHCEDHGVHVQREDAYSYAQSPDGVGAAMDELAACREACLDVRWAADADVPFPFHGGVRLADQAQLDPLPLLSSLVVELETRQRQATNRCADRSSLRRLRAAEVSFHARQCVLATGVPILDRGLFFARLKPQRSYCLGFDVPGDVTHAMFITVDSPTRSIRYAPTPEGEKLVVGGAGHTVGRSDAPSHSVEELARWAKLHYPGAVQTHFWSAQDYTPIDELPYVGPILPNTDKIYVATGFDKGGMTNGVAAAPSISSDPRRPDGLGTRLRQLAPARARGRDDRIAVQPRGRRQPGQGLGDASDDRRPSGRGSVHFTVHGSLPTGSCSRARQRG
ncbi:MAG: glycine/D-amino acid oxidase, deaminating, partial [Mycobacterium sp.]|nr:glycine/D-amino acid oxidase, deaminating [Mycobacterium sp.]